MRNTATNMLHIQHKRSYIIKRTSMEKYIFLTFGDNYEF